MEHSMEQKAAELIRRNRGRVTKARVMILSELLSSHTALTRPQLEALAANQGIGIDRVTVYRVMDWLLEKGLAHRFLDHERLWRFSVTPGSEEHAHFHCRRCDNVFCLPEQDRVPSVKLPRGYQLERVDVAVAGLCSECVH